MRFLPEEKTILCEQIERFCLHNTLKKIKMTRYGKNIKKLVDDGNLHVTVQAATEDLLSF